MTQRSDRLARPRRFCSVVWFQPSALASGARAERFDSTLPAPGAQAGFRDGAAPLVPPLTLKAPCRRIYPDVERDYWGTRRTRPPTRGPIEVLPGDRDLR